VSRSLSDTCAEIVAIASSAACRGVDRPICGLPIDAPKRMTSRHPVTQRERLQRVLHVESAFGPIDTVHESHICSTCCIDEIAMADFAVESLFSDSADFATACLLHSWNSWANPRVNSQTVKSLTVKQARHTCLAPSGLTIAKPSAAIYTGSACYECTQAPISVERIRPSIRNVYAPLTGLVQTVAAIDDRARSQSMLGEERSGSGLAARMAKNSRGRLGPRGWEMPGVRLARRPSLPRNVAL
jgi:hypothetical protein